MSIRAKAISIIISTVIILLILVSGISKLVWERSISNQENSIVNEKVAQVEKLISYECASINSAVSDWAIFNDTYNFMKNHNHEYIESNLQQATFTALNMNYIIYVDKNRTIAYEKGYDLEKHIEQVIPVEVHEYLVKNGTILKNSDVHKSIFGLIPVKHKILMVSSNPISTSDGESPMNGTLVMARYITISNMQFVEELTNSKISLQSLYDMNNNTKTRKVFSTLNRNETSLERLNDRLMIGYRQIEDINNKPAIMLSVEIVRDVYKSGKKEQQVLVASLLASLLAVFAVFVLLLQKIVIRKIVKLNNFVKEITSSGDKSRKILVKGSDEISSLSSEINKMLEKITSAEIVIEEKEKQLERVLEGSNDGFWDWNINKKSIDYSERALHMLSYKPGETANGEEDLFNITHPDDVDGVQEALNKALNGVTKVFGREYRLRTKEGVWKWFLVRGKIAGYNDDGTPNRMAGTITDISDRKKTEEEIRYLSYNDKLTGLFNRAYFEKEMEYIDTTSELPYTFIIGDLNGLKLANDVFGHDEGDRLLQEIASILRKSCRDTDVISRWGGDEFAILLVAADEKIGDIVCARIRENCSSSEAGIVKPSIALGMATKNKQAEDMAKLVREAEARMYQNKTQEGSITRKCMLESLRLELEARSFENQQHYNKLKELSHKFGNVLQLSNEDMDKLILLCEYHDIGEITLPASILKKQQKLDAMEWDEIKKHPETGYRIAKAIPEIAHIAENIVKHQERFDGSGYPFGIKGNDIPRLTRIFAIIDSYASMTRENSYKRPISSEEALEQIKKHAGTWYDPELVEKFVDWVMSHKENERG